MTRIIAIANRKGGSAKTVTAINLAGALVEAGYTTLVIDLDPQGSLTRGLGLAPRRPGLSDVLIAGGDGFTDLIQPTQLPGLSIIPADNDLNGIETGLREVPGRELRLRRCFTKFLTRDFDFILLDCPPSLGALTVNALVAAGEVIIPVDCGSYGREALASTLSTLAFTREEINYNLRILGILVCNINNRTSYDQLAESSMRQQFGDMVFEVSIPTSIRVDEAAESQLPVVYYDRRSSLANRFRQLAREVVARGDDSGHSSSPEGAARG